MPKPGNYKTESDFMHDCVPTMMDEGRKQDQAVAACMDIWKRHKKELEMDKPIETEEEAESTDSLGSVLWENFTLWERLRAMFKERTMKTVGGESFPSSDFLVVEDPSSPSTWHLQVKKHGKPDHNLMGAAKAALTSAGGHRGNKYAGPSKSSAISKLKRLYNSEGMEWTESKENTFFVWKEAGQYRWLALYSNKFRDKDNPPEILAEKAHQDFVAAVDKGEWPMPELWLWHVKGTRSGAADFVAYDDNGFSLASGTFDPDKQQVAEQLSAMTDLLTSHGMPVKEIQRDETDPTVITRYRSIEISALPSWAAANPYGTHFTIFKEVEMALPESKRPFLEEALGKEAVDALERQLADKAKELEDQGVEFKEAEAPVQEPETKDEATEPEAVEAEAKPDYATRDEVVEAVAGSIKPLMEQMAALATQLESLGKELKELKVAEDEKLKQLVQETPAASLFARVQSAIGAPEAAIDGRSSLAKSGPAEAPASGKDGATLVPFINDMIAKQQRTGG